MLIWFAVPAPPVIPLPFWLNLRQMNQWLTSGRQLQCHLGGGLLTQRAKAGRNQCRKLADTDLNVAKAPSLVLHRRLLIWLFD